MPRLHLGEFWSDFVLASTLKIKGCQTTMTPTKVNVNWVAERDRKSSENIIRKSGNSFFFGESHEN